ncbi:MAG: TetR/AcrR family transcriptional regulator C-terminal domain-containing protein [Actinomycetota bacterium]
MDGTAGVDGRDGARTPEPPWRAPGASRPAARIPLTREAIVEAALRVVERDGIEGVSMRRVGEELGTGAASLYWHVRNKGELLQLVFEHVTDEVVLPPPDPSRWREQVRELAGAMRTTLNRHRGVAQISLGRIPSGPTLARLSEWLFELLRPVGIPDRAIAYFGDVAGLYVGASAFEESLGLASPTGEDLPPEEIVAMMRDYMASLPEDRFPATRGAVDVLFGGDPEERFEFGLDLIIRGLESHAAEAKR